MTFEGNKDNEEFELKAICFGHAFAPAVSIFAYAKRRCNTDGSALDMYLHMLNA
ncbi:hypothetical protein HAX54_034168, partial [Datura stramonium]|nr:hypothetical protein [Datura stramonium]